MNRTVLFRSLLVPLAAFVGSPMIGACGSSTDDPSGPGPAVANDHAYPGGSNGPIASSPNGGPTTTDGGPNANGAAKCGGTHCGAGALCVADQCEYTVCSGYHVPGDYATVQAAADALRSIGGTICIGVGTWNEDVYVGAQAPITVMGVSSSKTLLRSLAVSSADGIAVDVKGIATQESCKVSGGGTFTFTNTSAASLGSGTAFATLPASLGGPPTVTITASTIKGGRKGLHIVSGGTVTVDGCDLSTTDGAGGSAILLEQQPPQGTFMTLAAISVNVTNSYIHGSGSGVAMSGYTGCSSPCPEGSVNWTLHLVNDTFAKNQSAVSIDSLLSNPSSIQKLQLWNDLFVDNTSAIQILTPSVVAVEHGANALLGNATNYQGISDGPGYVKSGVQLDASEPPGLLATSAGRGAGDKSQAPPVDYWGAPRGEQSTSAPCKIPDRTNGVDEREPLEGASARLRGRAYFVESSISSVWPPLDNGTADSHNSHIMKQTSLAHAKAHLSEIVDAAEHRGVSTLIHRHGKPSAVIVPVALGMPKKAKRRGMTAEEIAAFWENADRAYAEGVRKGEIDPNDSAVEDLIASRR